jgi:hypothetical protein
MNDIDALLLDLDAEPSTQLTPAETARSERLLAQISQYVPSAPAQYAAARPAAVRRPGRARLTLGVAGVAAAAMVVGVAAGGQFLGHTADHQTGQARAGSGLTLTELADWTATPAHPAVTSPMVQRTADACLAAFVTHGTVTAADISDIDQRGSVITLAATDPASRITVWCMAASQNVVFSQVVNSPQRPLPAFVSGAADLQTAGWDGSGRDEISFAYGQAGADVTGLSLKTPAGETITATVGNGLWSLWWPPKDSLTGDLGATVTWKTADGASHTAPLLSLYPRGYLK